MTKCFSKAFELCWSRTKRKSEEIQILWTVCSLKKWGFVQVRWELRAMNIWKSLTGEEWERKRSRKHWDAVEVRHSTFWNNDLTSYVIPSGVSDRKGSRWGAWGWRLGSRRASAEWMMGSEEVYPWAKWWKEWMKIFRPKKRGDFPSAPLQNRVSPRIDGD